MKTSEDGRFPYNRRIPLTCGYLAMAAFLDEIVASTRRRVARSKSAVDLRALERQAEKHIPRGFRRVLAARSQEGIAVIAELKKASPSKGLIRAEFEPAALARELEEAGAAALSVLTDEEFFQGSLDNLRKASASVAIPCLRKDFIVDEFQLLEAQANSADAVLLIMAALSQEELISLSTSARSHGLDVLCEVHDRQELDRALEAGCDLIGVNTRDLRTFKVDLQTAIAVADRLSRRCYPRGREWDSFRSGCEPVALGWLSHVSGRRVADAGGSSRCCIAGVDGRTCTPCPGIQCSVKPGSSRINNYHDLGESLRDDESGGRTACGRCRRGCGRIRVL